MNRENYKNRVYWRCRCDCGNEKLIRPDALIDLKTKSCGCIKKERDISKGKNKKSNVAHLVDEYYILKTKKGQEIKIDVACYEVIKNYYWRISENGYVITNDNNTGKKIYLHRLVTNAEDNFVVDHINHNKLDNTLKNLRVCSQSENLANQKLSTRNTSGVKGVSWDKRTEKWVVQIGWGKENIRCGYFDSFEEATQARKQAEEKYFKEYSYYESIKED